MDVKSILNLIVAIITGLSAGGIAGFGVARRKCLFFTLGVLVFIAGSMLRKLLL